MNHARKLSTAICLSTSLALSLTVSAQGWDEESTIHYEARLSSETLHPEVAGEARELDLQLASLQLREAVAYGIYGGLSGGFPSMRWQQPGREDSPRMGGWQLGVTLGGRHPRSSPLAFIWEAGYHWTQVSGDLAGDESLTLDLREGSGRAGLEWQQGNWAIAGGWSRRQWQGEERIDATARGASRNLRWRPDDHAFLETRLRLDDSGWLSLGITDSGEDGRITLGFGRSY